MAMQEAREKGNDAFRKGNLDEALKYYEEALSFSVTMPQGAEMGGVSGVLQARSSTAQGGQQLIQCLIHGNMAAVYLLKSECIKALDHASRSVAIDPAFAKGHYRRGKALEGLDKMEEAVEAYAKALLVTQPSDEAARAEVKSCLDSARLAVACRTFFDEAAKGTRTLESAVEVKSIDRTKGRGVFAARAVAEGETLLQERPLVSAIKFAPHFIIAGQPSRRLFKCCHNCMRYVDDFDWGAYFGTMLKGIEATKAAPNPARSLPPDVDTFASALRQGQQIAEAVIQKQSPAVPCPHCAGEVSKPPLALWQSVFRVYPGMPPPESYEEIYCSEACRKDAWESYHQVLCPSQVAQESSKLCALMNLLIMYREVGHHTVGMMLKILAQRVIHMKSKNSSSASDVFPMDLFATDSDEVPLPPQRVFNEEKGQFVEPSAADVEHQQNTQRHICDLMQVLFPDLTWPAYQRLQARIAMNAQQCAVPSIPREVAAVLRHCFPTEDLGFSLQTEGVGLYAVACSINHSCVPNACHAVRNQQDADDNNNTIVLRAMRGLKKGEEVTIAYLDESRGVLPKRARQDFLWRKFLFRCRCPRCESETS